MKHVSIIDSSGIFVNRNIAEPPDGTLRNKDSFECSPETFTLRNNNEQGTRMIDIVMRLRYLLSVSKIRNDGAIFRLHSLTTILILTFSLIISSKQVVGNPIECIHTREIPVEAFNSYCWIHSTYFVTGAMLGNVGVNVAAPGIAPSYQSFQPNQSERRKNGAQTTTKNVKYYQWVLFVLVFQAILFYTPRWLWKGWEGGKIHALMMDLDIGLCSEVEKKQKKKMLLDYLWENLRYHNWWAYRYYLCEVLALLNVIDLNVCRSDVSDEPLLRRCLFDVWYRRAQVSGIGSGGPGRSDDLCVPANDQVHLLQIWRQW
nr:PREDICTED: innexin shaking-B isoform X4 [Megachile rotundata]